MKSKILSKILSEVTPEIEAKVEQKANQILAMNEKEKYFIDLSKCTHNEIMELFSLTRGNYKVVGSFTILHMLDSEWVTATNAVGKTEFTYPEFIKLFEDGEDYPGKRYQPLFDHLNREHGLILHESEMDEIIRIVGGLNSNQ